MLDVSERYLFTSMLQNTDIFYMNIFVNVLMCSEYVVALSSPCCLGYQYYDDCSGEYICLISVPVVATPLLVIQPLDITTLSLSLPLGL